MKKFALFGVWLIASALATAVSWAGVAVVDSQVIAPSNAIQISSDTEQPPSAPTQTPTNDAAVQVAGTPDADPLGQPSPSATALPVETDATAGSTVGPTPAGVTATAVPSGVGTVGPTAQPSATSTAAGVSALPATPSATATPVVVPPPASPSAPIAPTPTPIPTATAAPVPTAPAPSPETRTVTAVGGTAAFEFSTEGAGVLWATPNAGFTVEVNQQGDRVEVRFRSSSHESRIEAWWDAGPLFSTDEKAD